MINFLKWLLKFKRSQLYPIFEGYFIIGSKKSFLLHSFLLWSNIFLFGLAIAELFFHEYELFEHYAYLIELTFGVFYLIEYVLKAIYVAIPNTIKGGAFMVINLIVIVSLITPGIFGNLAILRIIRSLKIIKIFYFKKEVKKEKKLLKNGK